MTWSQFSFILLQGNASLKIFLHSYALNAYASICQFAFIFNMWCEHFVKRRFNVRINDYAYFSNNCLNAAVCISNKKATFRWQAVTSGAGDIGGNDKTRIRHVICLKYHHSSISKWTIHIQIYYFPQYVGACTKIGKAIILLYCILDSCFNFLPMREHVHCVLTDTCVHTWMYTKRYTFFPRFYMKKKKKRREIRIPQEKKKKWRKADGRVGRDQDRDRRREREGAHSYSETLHPLVEESSVRRWSPNGQVAVSRSLLYISVHTRFFSSASSTALARLVYEGKHRVRLLRVVQSCLLKESVNTCNCISLP